MLVFFVAPVVRAEVYTVFSDKGIPPSFAGFPVPVYGNGGYLAEGQNSDFAVPEGTTSFKMSMFSGNFAGWGFDYGVPQNLSRFATGELRFWIYSPTGNIEFAMKRNPLSYIYQNTLQAAGLWNSSMANRWALIRVPMAGKNLSGGVQLPCLFTILTPGTFYIDNVRFVDSTQSPNFSARLCAMGDTTCVSSPSQVTWSGVTPATTWKVADQYIQMTIDADTVGWGVQIYTNNTTPSSNPQYAGPGTSNPAGLISVGVPTHRLPLAWSVKAGTGPVTGVTPAAADPNNPANLNSFQWVFMKDIQTPNVPAENTTAFANDQADVVVRNNKGIHFGQSPLDFGAENSPNYLFLESNFAGALAQQTYQTSKLTVEFYSL